MDTNERIMSMLYVLHEENKSIADIILNLAFSEDKATEILDKIHTEWDRAFNLSAFGEYTNKE